MASNSFFQDEHTSLLQKLVREVVNDPSTYLGSKYLPSIALAVRRIRTEVVQASGGLTNEHAIGTDPKYIQSTGTRVQEFEPPAYKESILYNEEKILYLRELGQNDSSKRGIRQFIDLDVDKLNRRLEARIEYLRWQAIFGGQFTYFGKTFVYGIPAANTVVPTVLWSLDGINANASANPIQDLRFWLTGGQANYRKYKFSKIVMNPNTVRWILDNANTQALIKTYFSAENFGDYDVSKVLKMLLPGLPPIEVYNGWYQSETVDATTGNVTVGDAIFFVPDGKIFFEASLPDGDKIGEFVQGLNLGSGTIDNPGFGKFLIIEDNTAPGTRGGPKNTFIDITAGVYGGPKLDRPFDVLTAACS